MAKAPTPGTTGGVKPGLVVGFNEQTWTFRSDGVSPKDVADLRRATGYGVKEIIGALNSGEGLDLDQAAGLIFLARRQSEGKWVSWDIATDGLGYDTILTLEAETVDDEDDDSPEA